ncbi:Glycogen debranching enzyme (alpha-1,6-glucosidase) [Micromonospora mirobrigensis]|uniref:Glycogen debranching enzyme (Alpha-1,6-glucosidase) n=2 Tax=Micromonospora mirobrigensis TaxID=262898 RepID=A0A1C4YTT4_9ACTN|nr:Glycogen debranching enzyme (alpha-1,6-glucosidase) [Micromonospora mirobrigensis]
MPYAPKDAGRQGEARAMPPELGPDAIAVVRGSTFMYSSPTGDVPAGTIGGLVHQDTRLISRWELRLDGAPLLALRSAPMEPNLAQFVLANPALPGGLPADAVTTRRMRLIGDSLHERVELQSNQPGQVRLELRLAVESDFADLFEVKSEVRDRCPWIGRYAAPDGSELRFAYEHEGFAAETRVTADPPADRIEGTELVWEIELSPLEEWHVDLRVPLPPGEGTMNPVRADIADVFHGRAADPAQQWLAEGVRLHSDEPTLERVAERSLHDLVALRLEIEVCGEQVILPAAGAPWFLTVFGRDTLIAAYQALAGGSHLAKGALLALAGAQGKRCDDFTDEEPGKILHEVRRGELTRQGDKPYRPYYGTADATQLWLIVLSEYWRWSGDDEFVRSLRPQALAALDWIDRYGDRDGDGYVEYATRSPQGLGNQCWRDSPDGVRFADGRIPVLPLATSDVQGYTYDAKVRLAELAAGPLADPALAGRLRAEADDLYRRFNRDFWIEERGGYYAVALDGDKQRVDSMTSNLGHLLWSGIVPPDRAPRVVRQLFTPAMFSGWGIRTMSREDATYNPLGYHQGTVWPHDNAIAVLGLTRYGYRSEANRLSLALLDAAAEFDHRLPEALSGLFRDRTRFAVPYPTACSPQAWAATAPASLVRSMLGLDPVDGRLVVKPDIPPEIGGITVRRLLAFGRRWDIEARGRVGRVRPAAD